jgi:hypothetical protein
MIGESTNVILHQTKGATSSIDVEQEVHVQYIHAN